MKKNILFSTNSQKALDFLLRHPFKDVVEREVSSAIKISRSGINYALRELKAADFLSRNKKGNLYFYVLNHRNPIVKQLKVLQTIIEIWPLCQKLTVISSMIILFGSSCRGEDTPDSDVDLFVVARDKDEIQKQIEHFHYKRKIQTIVRSPLKFDEMKHAEPDFYEQVIKGIVLWRTQDES